MRKLLPGLIALVWISLFASCSNDTTQPPTSTHNDGTISGQIGKTDFEFEVRGADPGNPMAGPFLLRGTNLHYDTDMGALIVDLTVTNRGQYSHHEPIGLTFIKLDPNEVTVLNPDNDIHDDGAAITFHFANDDGLWTPGETSLPRTVEFGVSEGVAIAFVARLDIGATVDSGTIDGRVWSDDNRDGVMGGDEHGIPGVAVDLSPFTDDSTQSRLIHVALTDKDGNYAFHQLPPGGYVVSCTPPNAGFLPTTPAQIHVILVQANGEVSSYHGANFGLVQLVPPPPTNNHVHAIGHFMPPAILVASEAHEFDCPDTIPVPLVDPPVNADCVGGTLRGPVTEVAPERNAFRLMATWILVDPANLPADVKVGTRLDVHVHPAPGAVLGWVADSIAPWTGDQEELQGRIERVAVGSDGHVSLLVLETWITVADVTVSNH